MPKIVNHDERRQLVASAAVDVVASAGLAGLTLKEVARVAGCTTGLVNHYFANKQELIVATAREAANRFSGGFFTRSRPRVSGPEQLVQLLLAMLPITDDDQPAHRVFVHLYSEGMTDPAVAAVACEYLDGGTRDARSVLERGQQDGWVAADLDCDVAARILLAAIDSFGIQRLLKDTAMTRSALRTHVVTLVSLVTKTSKVSV